MTIETITSEIDLLEMDAGFNPNVKKREQIAILLVEIYHKKNELYKLKKDSKEFFDLKQKIAQLYNQVITEQSHPKGIINYFCEKRWINFANKQLVYLDAFRNLLWPKKSKQFEYQSLTLSQKNREIIDFELDGFKHWQLPSKRILHSLFGQKPFPYSLKGKIDGFTDVWVSSEKSNAYCMLDRLDYDAEGDKALFIPFSNDLNIIGYQIQYKKNPIFVLQTCLTHDLIPNFQDEALQSLYQVHYVRYYDLLLQQYALNNPQFKYQPKKLEVGPTQKGTLSLTPYECSEHFDDAYLNTSVIAYYPTVDRFLADLTEHIACLETQQQPLMETIQTYYKDFEQPFQGSDIFDDALRPIYETLRNYFMLATKSPITELSKMKSDLAMQAELLNQEQTITTLAQIEKMERPSFTLLKEYSVKLVNKYILILSQFEEQKEKIEAIISIYSDLQQQIKAFDKMNYIKKWEAEAIDEEVIEQLLTELQQQLTAIYQLYAPFFKQALFDEVQLTTFKSIITKFNVYSDKMKQFFQDERLLIHQKYAFQAGGDIQEKLEAETAFYKIVSTFLYDSTDIMTLCKTTDERKLVLTNLQPVLAISIKHVDTLMHNFDDMANILKEFNVLKQQQLAMFAEDTESFVEAQRKREQTYNSLMYKMRKELTRSGRL